jgi:hypothetical protein
LPIGAKYAISAALLEIAQSCAELITSRVETFFQRGNGYRVRKEPRVVDCGN